MVIAQHFYQKAPNKIFGNILTQEGFHSTGNEYLYNGMTGEQLETEIYFGPTYYLRLKHMPKDKINFRARGQVKLNSPNSWRTCK